MKPFLFTLLTILLLSCTQEPKLQYKYSDKEQIISCPDQNNTLLNEALHSFEQDLLDHNKSGTKSIIMSYGQFIYKGMEGTAQYNEIINEHSLAIRDELLKENILITNGVKSNLNYAHPAVQCILDKIEDVDAKKTIHSLLDLNGMDPALFSNRFRNFGRRVEKNRNQALYIALDSYYQNLIGLTLEEQALNE